MALTLPVDGQSNWGDELNAAVTQADTDALAAQTSINNHAANSPPDPHGDRAFSQSLVTPITSGVNGPNGYLKLNGSGQVPSNLISGGLFTNVYDVVSTYGASNNGSTNASVQIQSALTAAASAGGGVVWVPDGTYAINTPLLIGAGTWLQLAPNATIRRISGASIPFWMVTNFASSNTTLNSPNAGPIIITGGTFDAVGTAGLTAQCTPIMMIQSQQTIISDVNINNVANNPAIELNGCENSFLQNVVFTGTGTGSPTVPAIRLNTTASGTTVSGLPGGTYNNAQNINTWIHACQIPGSGSMSLPYGSLVGTDLTTSGQVVAFTNIQHSRAPVMSVSPVVPKNWIHSNIVFNRFDGFLNQGIYSGTDEDLYVGALSSTGAPTSTNVWIDGFVGWSSGGSQNSEAAPESWHSLGGGGTGVTVTNARYMMLATGFVAVDFNINVTIAQGTITFANSLSGVYLPSGSGDLRMPMSQGNSSGAIAHIFISQSSGQVQMVPLTGNLLGQYDVHFQFPTI